MDHPSPDARLAAHVSQTYGVFDHAQALALGFTQRANDHRVRTRRWIRLFRGVYRLAGLPPDPTADLLAAVLACGEAAVASHRSAAWLHGLCSDPPPQPTVVVPPGRRITARSGIALHRGPVVLPDICRRRGVPSVVADLALVQCSLHRDVKRLIDEALRLRVTTPELLAGRADSLPLAGCAEYARFRQLVDEQGPRTRSVLEDRFRDRVLTSHLPRPEFNASLVLGGILWEVDVLWRPYRVVVELDSRLHLSAFVRAKDQRKEAIFEDEGYEIMRFVWADIVHAAPAVIARIERRLRARGWS